MPFNPQLMKLAQWQAERHGGRTKSAIVGPGGGDPAMAAGGPPGVAGGGPPPGVMPPPGGAPPMDPMAGGAPPMDPAAGGAPMDPAMAGGAPVDPMIQQMITTAVTQAMGGAGGAGGAAGGKMKPDQMIQLIDTKFHHMQMMMSAIANALGVEFPPEVLVDQPIAPVAAGPDPNAAAAASGGAGGPEQQSAISPIEPMQGAMPMGDAGGGGGEAMPKAASVGQGISEDAIGEPVILGPEVFNLPQAAEQNGRQETMSKASAVASLARSLRQRGGAA